MTQELHGVISLGGTVIGGSLNQRGLKGETGDKGDKGDAATIAVGNTTTGAAGTNASVTNSGDEHDAVFDFTIPKGDKGEIGDVNTYIAEYGTASYADIGDAITEGKYVIAVKDDNYYPLIMFSNSSYVFSYIHENICHEVVCDSYSTWTARTHTSVRDVKQNGASVTTSGVALVTTPQPTTTTPKMDGTAAVGLETTWAKGDHIHPSDTTKVDKEVGKGLSANDFTDSLKTKLEGVESGAEVNVQSDWNQSTNTADDYIKNKPNLSVYAPLDSPSLTGTPTAPTATEGTNTTQIATTAFVKTGDDAVKEMIKNTLPTDTASGSIASFEDGSDLFDYLSCVVEINPVQAGSGTPSPDNVRPITGWTGCEVDVAGVNLFDKSTSLDGYIENTDGVYHAAVGYKCTDYIKINGGDSYYIVSEQIAAKWGAWYDKDKAYISGITGYGGNAITAPNNATYMRLTIANNETGDVDTFAVNTPSTDHDYHAYNGTTYPVSWQTEAGTVYGGTVDLVTGVLTVDRKLVNIDPSTVRINAGVTDGGRYIVATTDAKDVQTSDPNAYTICNTLKSITSDSIEIGGSSLISSKRLSFMLPISTQAEARQWFTDNPTTVVYPLAQAQTYQLDPVQVACLLGCNNVWADCGDVAVKYKADVQKWVEKQLREINTAILALS